MHDTFHWGSGLGASVILFLVIGTVWVLIGALTIPFHKSYGSNIVFVSSRTDTAYFGESPETLLAKDSPIAKLRSLMMKALAGLLLAAGFLVLAVAWFGLRESETWALVSLGVSVVVAIAVFAYALLPYFDLGFRVSILDLPPFMWVPAMLVVPALALGWIGLK